jgi:crossover junction endodeoxyribonuclease RuvC
MQHAIMRELSLQKLPEPHDVSDALALALCHHYLTANTIVGGGVRAATFTGVNRDALFGKTRDDEQQ